MHTSNHEQADGREKGFLLSIQTNAFSSAMQPSQTWPKNSFSLSTQRISPFSSAQIQLDHLKIHIPSSEGTLPIYKIPKGFCATKS